MTIAAVLLCALVAWGFIERELHRRMTERIPMRVLVNGTRGKTSTARLAAAALNAAGIRTWAKTTGSQARYIAPNGTETDYRGNHAANLMEQLKFFRRAAADNAQAVVVECMAISDENQRAMAHHLVRPTHVLMTNALVDHVDAIGDSVAVTARTLAMSVPEGAMVFAGSEDFKGLIPSVCQAPRFSDTEILAGMPFPAHPQNVGLVLALTDALGIDRNTALVGMRSARPDAGMAGPFQVGRCLVINAFAVNDVPSFLHVLEGLKSDSRPVHLLFNHRADRAYRLRLFAGAVASSGLAVAGIGTTGDSPAFAARVFGKRTDIPAFAVPKPQEWLDDLSKTDSILVCFGNIKGQGLELITQLMEERHA